MKKLSCFKPKRTKEIYNSVYILKGTERTCSHVSAQSLYALRVLLHHGLSESGLQTIFRAVIVSRLTYAASAWFGFITSTDKQRIEAFFRRRKRSGYCSQDLPDFVRLVEEGDERLFERINNNNSSHVLRELLPPPSMATQQYNLRRRPHDRQMPDHTAHLADKNFLIRMLFKDSY